MSMAGSIGRSRVRTVVDMLAALLTVAMIGPPDVSWCRAGTPAGERAAHQDQGASAAQDRAGDAGRSDAGSDGRTSADAAWWHEARLGMFVHWGLYSVAAGQWEGKDIPGWGEWLLNKIKVDPAVYASTLMPRFDPVKFDADAWVRAAKDAGMGYIVVTTKHHDGFLLWDSATTELDLSGTPFGKAGRDPLRELAQACTRHGLRLGLYFSLMDWSDRDYLPRRDWDTRTTDGASMPRFVDRMHAQVKELTDGRFGPVAILWGDGDWEHSATTWRAEELMAAVRTSQPGILINDRWSLPGDYATPENRIPDGALPTRPWETCMTMNGTWGHVVHDHRWKPAAELIRNLVDIVSKDGNYLLNVGPMGDGAFDAPTAERLEALGMWMRTNGEAIRGCGPVACARPAWGRLTASADQRRVHAIVFDLPTDRTITIEGIAGAPASARVLGAPDIKVSTRAVGASLSITLGEGALDPAASVIVLEWAGEPAIVGTPELIGGDDLFLHETELAFKPRRRARSMSRSMRPRPRSTRPATRCPSTCSAPRRCVRGRSSMACPLARPSKRSCVARSGSRAAMMCRPSRACRGRSCQAGSNACRRRSPGVARASRAARRTRSNFHRRVRQMPSRCASMGSSTATRPAFMRSRS